MRRTKMEDVTLVRAPYQCPENDDGHVIWAMPREKSVPTAGYEDDPQAFFSEYSLAHFYGGRVYDRACGVVDLPYDEGLGDDDLCEIAALAYDLGVMIGV